MNAVFFLIVKLCIKLLFQTLLLKPFVISIYLMTNDITMRSIHQFDVFF